MVPMFDTFEFKFAYRQAAGEIPLVPTGSICYLAFLDRLHMFGLQASGFVLGVREEEAR